MSIFIHHGCFDVEIINRRAVNSPDTLLWIHGYLNGPNDPPDSQLLADGICNAGWRGYVAVLHWNAGDLCGKLSMLAQSLLVTLVPIPWLPTKVVQVGRLLIGLGSLCKYWEDACDQADRVGGGLARWLVARSDEIPGRRLILVGHSLGCRVIYQALAEAARSNLLIADQAWLLGGAVPGSVDWHQPSRAVRDRIVNAYSPTDWVLKFLFPIVGFELPIGVMRVSGPRGKIANRNVRQQVGGHTGYHGAIGALRKAFL